MPQRLHCPTLTSLSDRIMLCIASDTTKNEAFAQPHFSLFILHTKKARSLEAGPQWFKTKRNGAEIREHATPFLAKRGSDHTRVTSDRSSRPCIFLLANCGANIRGFCIARIHGTILVHVRASKWSATWIAHTRLCSKQIV